MMKCEASVVNILPKAVSHYHPQGRLPSNLLSGEGYNSHQWTFEKVSMRLVVKQSAGKFL